VNEGERAKHDVNDYPRGESSGYELVVVSGDALRVCALPVGNVRLGRAEDNDVRIDHESVSRWHAVLRVGDALVIEDLGAANGTFVPARKRQIDPGQTRELRRLVRESAEVMVGDTLMLGAVSGAVRRVLPVPATVVSLSPVASPAPDVVGHGAAMLQVRAQAELAARASISVLVLGETGVGKEVMARTIHERSPRAGHPFLALNCSAFGEQLLEGELFGYERGAFTGAVEARPGLFEAADGGTVFLDEVGELTPPTQAKLLRVLEARTVMRLGGRKPRAIDVRFVAATNRNLDAAVESGAFRRDLFYRLNGLSLTIPPLRERPTELAPLARGFVELACRELDRPPLHLSDDAMAALAAHAWPGNVRELRNAMERAVVLCLGEVIEPLHLPQVVANAAAPAGLRPEPALEADSAEREPELDADRYAAQLTELEKARIVSALKQTGGNQTEAAKVLGMARRTLISRLEALELPRPRKGNR